MRYWHSARCAALHPKTSALGGSAPSISAGAGDLLILVGSLCAALYVTLAGRVAPHVDEITLTAWQFLAGTPVAVPFVGVGLVSGPAWTPRSSVAHWCVAAIAGIGGLAASFLLYNHTIAPVPTVVAGMTLNLIPIFGLAGGVLLLGESIGFWQLLGAALIISSTALFTLSESQSRSPQNDTQATGGTARRRWDVPRLKPRHPSSPQRHRRWRAGGEDFAAGATRRARRIDVRMRRQDGCLLTQQQA